MSDRLALSNAIEDAGIPRDKAERLASVIYDTIRDNVVTKPDLELALDKLSLRLNIIITALVLIGLPSLWLLLRIGAKVGALPV